MKRCKKGILDLETGMSTFQGLMFDSSTRRFGRTSDQGESRRRSQRACRRGQNN
jgi:hypothetical protein